MCWFLFFNGHKQKRKGWQLLLELIVLCCIVSCQLQAPESNQNGIVSDFVLTANIVSLSKESISYHADTGDLHPK